MISALSLIYHNVGKLKDSRTKKTLKRRPWQILPDQKKIKHPLGQNHPPSQNSPNKKPSDKTPRGNPPPDKNHRTKTLRTKPHGQIPLDKTRYSAPPPPRQNP